MFSFISVLFNFGLPCTVAGEEPLSQISVLSRADLKFPVQSIQKKLTIRTCAC
jgi:hypothetical protein